MQSDVVADPYLRLFVPLSPRHVPTLVRANCPGVTLAVDADAKREDARRRALLDCIGRLLAPRLDGALISPAFEFGDDPASSAPGVVAHVSLAEVASGRHELMLERLRERTSDAASADEPERIAFWR